MIPLSLGAVRLDDRLVSKRGRSAEPVVVAMIHRKDRVLAIRPVEGGRPTNLPVRVLAKLYRIDRPA